MYLLLQELVNGFAVAGEYLVALVAARCVQHTGGVVWAIPAAPEVQAWLTAIPSTDGGKLAQLGIMQILSFQTRVVTDTCTSH